MSRTNQLRFQCSVTVMTFRGSESKSFVCEPRVCGVIDDEPILACPIGHQPSLDERLDFLVDHRSSVPLTDLQIRVSLDELGTVVVIVERSESVDLVTDELTTILNRVIVTHYEFHG